MRAVFVAALGFAAALALCEFIGAYALIPVGACALFSLAAYLIGRKTSPRASLYKRLAVFFCAAAVGAGWHSLYTVCFYSPAEKLMGTSGEFEAVVRDYTKRYSYGAGVEVELDGVGANARVRLWMQSYEELKPGDRIVFRAALDAPDSTPGFDFLSFYRSRGVYLDGEVSELMSVERAGHTPLRFIPAAIRRSLGENFEKLYTGDSLALVKALCLGDRSEMSESLRLAVRAGGLSHLLAISGLHVTMLCGALMVFFKNRRGRTAAGVLSTVAALLFVLVCGAPASAVRAFVMHALAMLAGAIRRDTDPKTALGASLLLLLIINPYSISDVGLLMSFLATLGLLNHLPAVSGLLREKIKPKSRLLRRLLLTVGDAAATCAVATLYTAPLAAYTFGSLPLYGVLSNIPALVLSPIALVGGLLSGLLQFISPAAARAVAGAVKAACSLLTGDAYLFARLPLSLVDMKSAYNQLALALGYALLLIWRLTPGHPRGKLCAALAAAAFCVSFALGEFERRSAGLDATVLDVGQGQSVLLVSGGQAAMVDCGGDCYEGAGCRAAETLMLSGRRKVDALVLTHYHADHTNGLEDLLDFVSIDKLYAPPPEADDELELVEFLLDSGAEVEFVELSDLELTLGHADLEIYRPVQRGSENESGICVLAECGGFRLLMTGDLGTTSEKILLEREPLVGADAIVAGHHGSRYSTGDYLLDRLEPRVALVSVGYNSYGHPAPSTLSRLDAHGCDVYRTDLGGSIRVRVGKGED